MKDNQQVATLGIAFPVYPENDHRNLFDVGSQVTTPDFTITQA